MKGDMLLLRHVPGSRYEMELIIMPFSPELKDMQEAVDGWIESLPGFVYFPFIRSQEVIGWCDDEGKLKGKPVTLPVYSVDGRIVDVLVGDILLTGQHEADTCPLTENAIEEALRGLESIYDGTNFTCRVIDRTK